MLLTDDHRHQFQEQDFFVLGRVIPAGHLEMMRQQGARLMAQLDEKSDLAGRPRTTKYFFSVKDEARAQIRAFVFSDLLAEATQALLGDDVFLSFEQFVVKAAEKGGTFAWHQDSAYVSTPHLPYLTCWCTLDDVSEENGTVYMLPYDRAGTRGLTPHAKMEGDFGLVGYRGDDPGVPVLCPAGSVAFFSSHVLHRSGPNTTSRQRRVYLPQYSSAPILKEDGPPFYIAEPFLRGGRRVAGGRDE